MATLQAAPGAGCWVVPEFPYTIEYSAAVLESVRAYSVDGLLKFRHRGIEVGGVLFGRREGPVLRILACREASCEYAFGPSFRLSERDREKLRRLIESAAQDPDLSGMEPVGWYRSYTRSQIELTEQDRSIHDACFPEPWQICLLLRPEESGEAGAGVVVRADRQGRLSLTAVERLRPAPRSSEPEAAGTRQAPPHIRPIRPLSRLGIVETGGPAAARPAVKRGWRWGKRWVAALACALAGALLILALLWRQPGAPAPARLRVFEADGSLHIEWNPRDPLVERAARGRLLIQDGETSAGIELDAATLRNGVVTYRRRSPDVRVRFIVPGPDGEVVTASRFLGELAEPPPAPPVSAAPGTPGTAPRPSAGVQTKPGRVRRPPPRRDPEEPERRPRPGAARAAQNPAPRPVELPAAQPLSPPAAPQPRSVQPSPVPAGAAYRGPESGRAIWTGRLRKGQRLRIQNGRPSTGFLTGQLPAAPFRISAYPGEFRRDGVVVFGLERSNEAPSSKNAWTWTEYRRSPERARDVAVTEAPGASNRWSRVELEAARDLAVVVLFWETVPGPR